MTKSITIALDAMGGDFGPAVVVPAAVRAIADTPGLKLALVGDQAVLEAKLAEIAPSAAGRVVVRHATERVEMDDLPSHALRVKKDSSMRVAIDLVKEGAADACVSAGNTGALMAIARFVLKTLPGIDRPAIITALPSLDGHTHVLDLGANVDVAAEHLLQFGFMGSELVTAVDGIERPRVALLNIGAEEIKGNEQVKEAARLLAGSPINYIGYVEGNQIFEGGADVVVCDGFVGNVMLKTSEGVAGMIAHLLRQGFTTGAYGRIAGLCSMPVLQSIRRKIDPRHYNGASLLGLRGIVVKSHGSADALAFANAIDIARLEVEKAVPQRISHRLADYLQGRETA